MNNVFTAKLLQGLRNKKGEKGFTLIELLVVVIIIGVLAAVALPNLLSQVGKARESEGKTMVGTLNKQQQTHFTLNGDFTSTLADLEIPTGNENYYEIAIPAEGLQLAIGLDNGANGTRDIAGAISYDNDDRLFDTIMCRATANTAANNLAATPASQPYTIVVTDIGGDVGVDSAAPAALTCAGGNATEEIR